MSLLSLYICNSLKGLCHEVDLVCCDLINSQKRIVSGLTQHHHCKVLNMNSQIISQHKESRCHLMLYLIVRQKDFLKVFIIIIIIWLIFFCVKLTFLCSEWSVRLLHEVPQTFLILKHKKHIVNTKYKRHSTCHKISWPKAKKIWCRDTFSQYLMQMNFFMNLLRDMNVSKILFPILRWAATLY